MLAARRRARRGAIIVTLIVAGLVGAASFVGWHAAEKAITPAAPPSPRAEVSDIVGVALVVIAGAVILRKLDTGKP